MFLGHDIQFVAFSVNSEHTVLSTATNAVFISPKAVMLLYGANDRNDFPGSSGNIKVHARN